MNTPMDEEHEHSLELRQGKRDGHRQRQTSLRDRQLLMKLNIGNIIIGRLRFG